MPILKVNHLTKVFHSGFLSFRKKESFISVNDISFELNKGEILGFLGPNGAGKTTTIQMLLGTLIPTEGSITYFDLDFKKNRINSLQRIGYASGYDKLPARLTVFENLDIVGRIYGIDKAIRTERIEKLLTFFGIIDKINKQTGTLSAGQSTAVMLVKAFIANPDIVLLDEPTASLDPEIAYKVRKFILQQRNEFRTSILITSHNMNEVTELCNRVIVLKNGSIIANDTPQLLAQSLSKVFITLTFSIISEELILYLPNTKLAYTVKENQVIIEINESEIATFLTHLAEKKIIYSHISIEKPTLEDYFLSVAKKEIA